MRAGGRASRSQPACARAGTAKTGPGQSVGRPRDRGDLFKFYGRCPGRASCGSWLGTRLRQMSAPAQVPACPRRQPRFSAKVSLDKWVAGRVRLGPAESFRAGTDPEDGAGSFAAEVAEGDVALVALVTLRPAAAADPPPPRCHSRSSRTLYRSTTRLAPASNRKGRCRKLRGRPAFLDM